MEEKKVIFHPFRYSCIVLSILSARLYYYLNLNFSWKAHPFALSCAHCTNLNKLRGTIRIFKHDEFLHERRWCALSNTLELVRVLIVNVKCDRYSMTLLEHFMHKWKYNINNIVGLHQLSYLCIASGNVMALDARSVVVHCLSCLCCLNIYVRSLQVGKLRPGEVLDSKVRFVLPHTKLAFFFSWHCFYCL